MGVLGSRALGISPSWAVQHIWPGGLLLFQHVRGDLALCAGGQAQRPFLE